MTIYFHEEDLPENALAVSTKHRTTDPFRVSLENCLHLSADRHRGRARADESKRHDTIPCCSRDAHLFLLLSSNSVVTAHRKAR